MSVSSSIQQIRQSLPSQVRLIAVSKFQPVEKLQEAYDCGQRLFGENRAQEMKMKHEALPADIEWHFIGHLQKNKIKYIVPFVSLIHSVDSPELLEAIDTEAARCGRTVPCLLEVHIASETSKFGFDPQGCLDYLAGGHWRQLSHVHLHGLMGMATFTDDSAQVEQEFKTLRKCFDTAKAAYFAEDAAFSELSMGMSEDYPIAVAQGSTLVRVGTAIFGPRPQISR